MARTKTAPTLEWLARHDWTMWFERPAHVEGDDGDAGWKMATKELHALLAVARVARAEHSHADVAYDPVDERHKCPICRACARLDRVSRASREGR